MLSWVFWHARFPEVPEAEYRESLFAFHRRIAAAAPDGFLGSRILSYRALPWLPSPTEVYEDWYYLRSSAALDPLDEQVLAAFTHDAHARVARLAATAVSGLYRLRSGAPTTRPTRCAWMSKPRGDGYPEFLARLLPAAAVWSRKMVLGPTPEFCVELDAAVPDSVLALAQYVVEPRIEPVTG